MIKESIEDQNDDNIIEEPEDILEEKLTNDNEVEFYGQNVM